LILSVQDGRILLSDKVKNKPPWKAEETSSTGPSLNINNSSAPQVLQKTW